MLSYTHIHTRAHTRTDTHRITHTHTHTYTHLHHKHTHTPTHPHAQWNADLKKKEQEFRKQAEDVKKADDAIRMNDVKVIVPSARSSLALLLLFCGSHTRDS